MRSQEEKLREGVRTYESVKTGRKKERVRMETSSGWKGQVERQAERGKLRG